MRVYRREERWLDVLLAFGIDGDGEISHRLAGFFQNVQDVNRAASAQSHQQQLHRTRAQPRAANRRTGVNADRIAALGERFGGDLPAQIVANCDPYED